MDAMAARPGLIAGMNFESKQQTLQDFGTNDASLSMVFVFWIGQITVAEFVATDTPQFSDNCFFYSA